MNSIMASSVIEAPVASVWALLRNFGAIHEWLPGVTRSSIEGDAGVMTIGAVRHLTLADGSTMRERLTGLSDTTRTVEFSIVETVLPIRDYAATIRLEPVTVGDRCFIVWEGRFDVDDGQADAVSERMLTGVFLPGFDGLERLCRL